MVSSVLRSPRAVEVNIAIMRTFVQLRRLIDGPDAANKKLAAKQRALKLFAPTQRGKKFFAGRIDVARDAMHSSFPSLQVQKLK